MKLIIDIDKDYYKAICKRAERFGRGSAILPPSERIIFNGTPLSEELENILAEEAELSEQSGFVSVAELISNRIEKLKGE